MAGDGSRSDRAVCPPMSSDHHHDHESLGPPQLQEVSDGVYAYIQPDGSWWINNTGFITASGGVISIDACSTEVRTRAYLDAMRRVTDQPVRTLVNTHHHGDHTHGNFLFRPATVVAHDRCRELVKAFGVHGISGVWTPVEWGQLELEPPMLTFADHVDLYADDLHIELRYIGGAAHTTNDIVAWLPERGVLFSGDLVFNGGTPFVMMGSVSGSLAALERVRSFGATTIVPGHGGVCGPEVIDRIAGYLRFVQERAAAAHAAGIAPLDAARQTDLGPYADWLDVERLVGNLHRAYAELDGAEPGAPLDYLNVIGDMIAYNGGQPLRCLA